MGQAEQLSNAAAALKAAAGKYTGASGDLAGIIGFGSGVISSVNALNQGQSIQAATKAWKGGARDGYRLIAALGGLSTQMDELANTIQSKVPAVEAAELSSLSGSVPLMTESQANAALSAITGQVNAFKTQVPNVATSYVIQGCSTGTEKLQAGQTDGTEGYQGFASKEAFDEWLDWMVGAESTTGGGGGGGGTGNGWWDALCNEGGTPLTATETPAEQTLLQKLQGLVMKDGSVNKATLAHIIGFPSSIFIVAAGYNAGNLEEQHGLTEVVKRAFLTSMLVTAVDGPLYFTLGSKITLGGKYKLTDCAYPATAAQGIVGLFGTMAAQLGLNSLFKTPTTKPKTVKPKSK